MVSFKLANELAETLKLVLVNNITDEPAGRILDVGSFRNPQPTILLFNEATFEAVVEFLQIFKYELFGQLTFKLFTFKLDGPTLNRTISFSPSLLPQASTRILSISKQVVGVCPTSFRLKIKNIKTTKKFVFVFSNMVKLGKN